MANKEKDFELVRIILRSKKFREGLTKDEQIDTLKKIQATGISDSEMLSLINQVRREQYPKIENLNRNTNRLEELPYDIFVKVVETGDIRGQDLIHLCETSDKINYYCNKELVLQNGLVLNQALF